MSEKTNHEEPQMEVEDEFQPDFVVPDIENHCEDEAEDPKVLIIQSDDIIAKEMKEAISDKSPEKVIHINTRLDTYLNILRKVCRSKIILLLKVRFAKTRLFCFYKLH